MQNQYFGDVGDYAKYGLLRWLSGITSTGPALRLGTLWYLTPDGHGNENDGRHVRYLDDPARFRAADPALFDLLRKRMEAKFRAVSEIESSQLLGESAVFFSEKVDARNREEWFARARAAVDDADLVFLDPDNGLQARGRLGRKHVSWSELSSLYDRGQSLVVYQHLDRAKGGHAMRIQEHLMNVRERIPQCQLFGLHCCRGTSRLFIVIPRPDHHRLLAARGQSLVAGPMAMGGASSRMLEPEICLQGNPVVTDHGAASPPGLEAPPLRDEDTIDIASLPPSERTAERVVGHRVKCPMCGAKVFTRWPLGWDAHAANRCQTPGGSPEVRKKTFRKRFAWMFRKGPRAG